MWNCKHILLKFQNTNLILFSQDKTWKIVEGLAINEFSKGKMEATAAELKEERDTAVAYLNVWLDPASPPNLHLDSPKTPDARLW